MQNYQNTHIMNKSTTNRKGFGFNHLWMSELASVVLKPICRTVLMRIALVVGISKICMFFKRSKHYSSNKAKLLTTGAFK